MTKPWEATWRWGDDRREIVSDQRDELDNEIVIVETDGGCYPPRRGDQELIAAAPEMARVLLSIVNDAEGNMNLKWALGPDYESAIAALKKAGVR